VASSVVSSNLYPCCSVVFLSATATFIGAVPCVRRRHYIRPAHGSSFVVNFESRDCFLVFSRDAHLFIETLLPGIPNYVLRVRGNFATANVPLWSGTFKASLSPSRSLYAVGTMPSSQIQRHHCFPTARFYPLNRSQ